MRVERSPVWSSTSATIWSPIPSWSSTTTRCSTTARGRPLITFVEDHLTDYRPPRLELSLAHDSLGHPFLLLAGYEPDFLWRRSPRACSSSAPGSSVVHHLVHAIPMPVPHTRPIGTTVSGTRSDLAEAHSVWRPHTQIPSTVGHLLEYRFAEAGAKIAGFALLVPH